MSSRLGIAYLSLARCISLTCIRNFVNSLYQALQFISVTSDAYPDSGPNEFLRYGIGSCNRIQDARSCVLRI